MAYACTHTRTHAHTTHTHTHTLLTRRCPRPHSSRPHARAPILRSQQCSHLLRDPGGTSPSSASHQCKTTHTTATHTEEGEHTPWCHSRHSCHNLSRHIHIRVYIIHVTHNPAYSTSHICTIWSTNVRTQSQSKEVKGTVGKLRTYVRTYLYTDQSPYRDYNYLA